MVTEGCAFAVCASYVVMEQSHSRRWSSLLLELSLASPASHNKQLFLFFKKLAFSICRQMFTVQS